MIPARRVERRRAVSPPGTIPTRLRWSRPLALAVLIIAGCASAPPIRTVDHVELERFMGQWYVLASIPTFLEQGAHNAVESYTLEDDGTIATTFTFRLHGFDGELKRFTPRGFVRDTDSNAVWGMQFVWPFRAEYRIVYLDEAYTRTIIGRSKRDYVWIMAREPSIPETELQALIALLDDEGYDTSRIVRVPQSWDESGR